MEIFCEGCLQIVDERFHFEGYLYGEGGRPSYWAGFLCEVCLPAFEERDVIVRRSFTEPELQRALAESEVMAGTVKGSFDDWAEKETAETKNVMAWGLFSSPPEPTGEKVTTKDVDRAVDELISKDDPEFGKELKVLLKPKGNKKHGRN